MPVPATSPDPGQAALRVTLVIGLVRVIPMLFHMCISSCDSRVLLALVLHRQSPCLDSYIAPQKYDGAGSCVSKQQPWNSAKSCDAISAWQDGRAAWGHGSSQYGTGLLPYHCDIHSSIPC